jgi:hypothetical protein
VGGRLRRENWSINVRSVGVALGVWAWCSTAGAQASPLTIWYRSSEGCPEGPQFLARLEQRAIDARLAIAGDRIDFVVTLGPGASGSSGTLERQTQTQTVAVRELSGQSCDQVADALALSLALAVRTDPEETPSEAPPTSNAAEPPAPTKPVQKLHNHTATRPAPDVVADAEGSGAHRSRSWLGLQGGVVTGVAPTLLPRALVYYELEANTILDGASARVAVSAARSLAAERDGLDVWLLAGRLDGCPMRLGEGALSARPCLAIDVGATEAEGTGSTGVKDTGFWASLATHARLGWLASPALSFELELGAVFPLTRYEFVAENSTAVFHRTAPAGFAAAVGSGFRLP